MEAQLVRKGLTVVAGLAAAWLIGVVVLNMAELDQEGSLYQIRAEERISRVVEALHSERTSMQDAFQELQSLAQEAREAERERAG